MRAGRLKLLEERTRYEPSEVEGRVFARWEDSGIFHPDPAGRAAANYSIAVPPPNVTGSLHMGHALNGSIQDVCIRLARMRGRRTKWIYGTDHAGIGTQRQVEKALEAEGTSREEIGPERFVERVWEWRRLHGSTITNQFRRLGTSLDYADERFTMDPDYVRAVTRVFVHLYEKGLIYRDNYMVNWDPGSHSAISDLEVENREVEDVLYSIDYPVEGSDRVLTVATVRPETMLGDTAIAVHPDDERYTRLVGEAATALGDVLKKTRLELAPEQQDMIDGVSERLSTYRSGIERTVRQRIEVARDRKRAREHDRGDWLRVRHVRAPDGAAGAVHDRVGRAVQPERRAGVARRLRLPRQRRRASPGRFRLRRI